MKNKIKNVFLYITSILFLIILGMQFFDNICIQIFELDYAWVWALNKIALSPDIIFGRDVVFTYGPLGFLTNVLYLSPNYWIALLFSFFLFVLFISTSTIYLVQEKVQGAIKLSLLAIIGAFSFQFTRIEWAIDLFFVFLLFNIYFTCSKKLMKFYSILIGIISIFVLLIKSTAATLIFSTLTVLAVLLYLRKKDYFKTFFISYIATTIPLLGVFILFLFKNFQNFFSWIIGSYEIAKGFNSTMIIPNKIDSSNYLIYLALVIAAVFIYYIFEKIKSEKELFFAGLILLPVLFIAFKQGFVRQDAHMNCYFFTLPYLAGIYFLFSKKIKKNLIFVIAISVLCMLYPLRSNVYNDLATLTSAIINGKKNLQIVTKQTPDFIEKLKLPTKANLFIKDTEITVLPLGLHYAQANNWNIKFSPTLLLYSAYTKKLDNITADFLYKKSAPTIMLLEFLSIDERNMFLDTPATMNAIKQNYAIISMDNRRMLLIKIKSEKPKFKNLSTKTYNFGEKIEIPQGKIYARIEMETSFLGKILTLLFRGNPPEIFIKYKDGRQYYYKIVTDTLKNPTLVSSIPTNTIEHAGIISDKNYSSSEVESIVFSGSRYYYKSPIKVEFLIKEN